MKFEEFKSRKILIFLLLFLFLSALYYNLSYKKARAEHLYLLGKAYESQGYYDKAKAYYEKSAKLKTSSIAYNALGNLNEFLGDNVASINAYEKGVKADKFDSENYFDAGRVYIKLQNYGQAEQSLMAIIENKQETAAVYSLLGSAYINAKKWQKAEDALKKSLGMQEQPGSYNDLGFVYENMKLYDLAVENYNKALQLDPNYGLAKNNLARLAG